MNLPFEGPDMSLGNLPRLSDAQTRSISAENPTGEIGRGGMAIPNGKTSAARELGQGWKVSPCINIPPLQVGIIADIQGPGAIQHIWMTMDPSLWRRLVLRFYWDEEDTASVEVPVEDLFCNGWGVPCNVASFLVAVNRAYFHAQWRRSNPVKPKKVHTLLDSVDGQGHYVGTYLAWGSQNNG
jgi:hypothetical protein